METCVSAGKGMYNNFADIWYTENNEPIMTQYYVYPEHVYDERGNRPVIWSNNIIGWNWPTLDLLRNAL
jgi:hypothetical protein